MRWMLGMIILGSIALYFQYRLWFGVGGMGDLLTLRHALSDQTVAIQQLKSQNATLLLQVKRLKESREAIEGHARNELGMIKKDEVFYQIVGEEGKE